LYVIIKTGLNFGLTGIGGTSLIGIAGFGFSKSSLHNAAPLPYSPWVSDKMEKIVSVFANKVNLGTVLAVHVSY
jgi:hypothetical protein